MRCWGSCRNTGPSARWRRSAITDTHRDVDDELFARVQRHYDDDTIAELTMIIAWENASSRFNRAFRIPSQGFWKR
jgi:alkylhydroperoxidase family enzyme